MRLTKDVSALIAPLEGISNLVNPDKDQAGVASVRKSRPAYIRYGQGQIAICPNVPGSRMRSMRQCCLYKRFGHETKRARIDRALGGNCFGS